MRRAILPLLLLPLFMFATALFAQDGFTGRYTFSQAPDGPPLMIVELAQDAGAIVGIGQTTPDLPGIGPSVVTVTGGAAFQGNLQLELALEPFDGSAPGVARFQVFGGPDPAASLIYAGRTVTGVFTAQNAGQNGLVPPIQTDTCIEMAELADMLNQSGGTEIVQRIRGLYSIAGLDFGGQQTRERCAQVLDGLQDLVMDMEGNDAEGGPNCAELDGLLAQTTVELARLGAEESAELTGILARAGLPVDLNSGGIWNATNCGRALPEVRGYLAGLRAAPTVVAPVVDYPREEMLVLPVTGFAPANGGRMVDLWDHNSSQMALESGPDNAMTFWYWAPRSTLNPVGVRRGTVLFSGIFSDTYVEGEARFFTSRCGTYSYYVSGNWTPGDAQIVLRGERPVISYDCEVEDITSDTLVFDYLAPSPNATQTQTQTQTQSEPQREPQRSNGHILTPIGATTITNQDLLRPAPEPVELYDDTPGFGVWAEIYEVYDVGANDSLNLRSGPGTGYGVLTQLPPFARDILVLNGGCTPDLDQIAFSEMSLARQARELRSRWCNIVWNGREGWVSGRYIRPY